MSSMIGFGFAYDEVTLTGNLRLALMAAGDGQGEVTASIVAKWCNVDEQEAAEIIDKMVSKGWFFVEDDIVTCPQILECIAEYRQISRKPRVESVSRDHIPLSIRGEVYERDCFFCHYCSSRVDLTVDHKIPISKGGDNSIDNLLTCCKSCNSAKGARPYDWYVNLCRSRGYSGAWE